MAETSPTPPAETPSGTAPEKAHVPGKTYEWGPLESLRREVDRLFDDFRPFDRRLPSRVFGIDVPRAGSAGWQVAPAVDLVEKEDAYEITAELPGLDEKDVEIKLANRTLTIKGEKGEEKEEKRKDYYLSERRYGSFQRSFRLPDGVDADAIDAAFARGVLTVRLPKTAEARQAERKIAVKGS